MANPVPKVGGTHIAHCWRVARAVVMPQIEGQEECVFAFQLGGHEYQLSIHGEMHQATLLEGKQ